MRFIFLLLILFSSNVYAGTSAFTAGSGALTDQHIGYGSSTNKIKGESAFFYNDSTNTMSVDNFTLRSNGNLRLNDADNSNYVELKSPAVVGTNRTFELPDSYGTAGQFLKTDGAGVMSWDTASGGGGGGGNPNLIINGGMDIWQRGTSFASPASDTVTVDRYRHSYNTGGFTILRSTDVPTGSGLTYSTQVDITTADGSVGASDYMFLGYLMEGYDLAKIKGKQFTLSFYVKSPKTGTHCVALRNAGTTRSYVTEYNVSSADTWERKEITITHNTTGTWDYTNGLGVLIQWQLIVGSAFNTTPDTWFGGSAFGTTNCNATNVFDSTANNFFITGIQLEVGSSASDFKTRGADLARELDLASRYFARLYPSAEDTSLGQGAAGGGTQTFITFLNVRPRVAPATSYSGTFALRCATVPTGNTVSSVASSGKDSQDRFAVVRFNHSSAVGAGNPCNLQSNITTDYIQFNAEL
jgi:hypothetical protein